MCIFILGKTPIYIYILRKIPAEVERKRGERDCLYSTIVQIYDVELLGGGYRKRMPCVCRGYCVCAGLFL